MRVPVLAHVEDEGTIIAIGKKVLTEQRDQQHRDETDEQEEGDKELARLDELREEGFVCGADRFKEALETALETSEDVLREWRMMIDGLEEIQGHGRHERSRKNVRGEHGEDNGFGERHEEVTRDAG